MHHFTTISGFKFELQSGNTQIPSNLTIFCPCDLEISRMTLKTIGHLFYTHSSFMHHFIAIGGFRFELQSGNAQIGSNLTNFCLLWHLNLRMTLKNNRAPLLCPFKLYASFRSHRWIPIWVTVRKRTNWLLITVTLTFDLWPYPFAWTPLGSLVIIPKKIMMIPWCEHSEKGVTEGATDRINHS